MKFGAPLSAGFGSPENWLTNLYTEIEGQNIRVDYTPAMDGWYGIYRNSIMQSAAYQLANVPVEIYVPVDNNTTRQMISVIRQGEVSADAHRSARWYDAQTSRRATLEWQFGTGLSPYEVMGSIDSSGLTKLTNWIINGASWIDLNAVDGSNCRGFFTIDITVSGGAVTLDLISQGTTMASGACTVGDICYLDEVNDSGIGAQVNTDPAIADGTETLYIRFPQEMKIIRSQINPPSYPGDLVATVPFDGDVNESWTETTDLAEGTTYYYRLIPFSDTGEMGDVSNTITVQIPGPPAPASNLAYASGNSTTLNLTFTPSTSPGVTYSAYVQAPGDTMNWNDPDPSAVWGVGTLQLSGLTNGVNYIVVRAYNGIEEKIGTNFTIEFDSLGNYVTPRPNEVSINSVDVTAGLTLQANVGYDPSYEVGIATSVNLYYKVPGGSYNLTPDATAVMLSEGYTRVANPSVTVPSTGWYIIKIFAVTGIGTESSTGVEEKVYVSDVAGAAPVGDGVPTRG